VSWFFFFMIKKNGMDGGPDAGRILAGHCTSLEHLVHQPLGAEALEIHFFQFCASLEKPSEYHFSFHAILCNRVSIILSNTFHFVHQYYFPDSYVGSLRRLLQKPGMVGMRTTRSRRG